MFWGFFTAEDFNLAVWFYDLLANYFLGGFELCTIHLLHRTVNFCPVKLSESPVICKVCIFLNIP